jgi:hypothetical protein
VDARDGVCSITDICEVCFEATNEASLLCWPLYILRQPLWDVSDNQGQRSLDVWDSEGSSVDSAIIRSNLKLRKCGRVCSSCGM